MDTLSVNVSTRRRVSLQYDSINDPHLRDYFEKKFNLSSAVNSSIIDIKLKNL
jgi:hypothetical protein